MSTPVKILRGPLDPVCDTRVSIGGSARVGYYCVYRGDRMACIKAISLALNALESIDKDPPIDTQFKEIAQ